MLLQKDGLVSINAVAHEGKVVVIATDKNGGLWYTVKQDGFEESYLGSDPAKRTGWENWAPVDLPDEADDASVVAFEKARLTRKVKPLTQLMRSVYKSRDLGAAFPVQLVSAQGHLYIFRQSKGTDATLLCDRFVLDGMTNKLGRKLEVRFKRSRQRLAPYEAGPKNAMAADSLDFRDTSGNFFYEPTTELLFTKGVKNGWFTVVRAATGEHEKFRWHIVYCNSKWAEMVSIRASEDGLFDLRDETTFDPAPGDGEPPIPRSIPGILWRTLKVPGAMITGGPAATLYDLQQEREVGNGGAMQLLRTETRLMLVLPTSQGTAAYSFALAKDGSLSELGSNGTPEVLRSDQREILLPLNTLDELKLIGDTTPPPQGTIRGMRLGSGDDNADGKVVVTSAEAALLSSGDTIEIQKTSNYDGLYTVSVIDDQSFVIDVDFVDNQLGVWEKVETEPEGLVFDGMVTSYEKIADGKLKVTARNHGLSNGDGVQLVGTVDCDGTFPVTRLDNSTFVIDGKWATSEAKNLRLESLKRRGLVLDGDDDHIDLPMDAFPGGKEVTICLWARGIRTADVTLLEATDKDGKRVALISFPAAAGQISFECGNGADGCDRAQKAAQPAEYTDGWAHWAFTKNAVSGELAIYRNGVLWTSSTGKFPIGAAKQLRLGASIAGTIGKNRFEGTLADLTIYGRALRAEEIRDTMFLALSGQEPGLLGYWRLGGVVEGEIRKVIDLSPNGWDGTVQGGAWAGAVTYERKLRDGKTLAVRYTNSELIAVSQRATYVEEFEFRITAAGKPLTKAALQNMERSGKPVFVMRYWGKRSRSAEETIVFNPQPKTDLFADVGDGWLRASCRLTIPDGVALLRSFEIAEVRGTWDRIEIRKHGMRLISDAITELYNDDAPLLQPLAAAGKDLETQLSAIRADEQTEAGLYADKLATEEKIALLADAEYLKIEYDALVKDVAALTTELQELESQYVAMKDNPFNYFCRLLLSGTTKRFLHCESTGDMVTWDVGNLFEFIPYVGGYCIKPIGENRYILPGSNGRVVLSPNDFKWPWQVVRSGNSCTIKHPIYGFFHAQGGTNKIVMYKDAHNWELQPVEEVGGKVTAAKNARDAKKTELTAAEKRLAALKKLLDPTAPKRADLEKEIQDIVAKLVVVQTRLTAANAKYLDGVKGLSLGALAMPQIAKDQRGLLTRGAMLDFVRPESRVSLLETCEGNVQLSYLDADGRMRITHYDATSDSRNPQVEEWLTDAGRACLRQSKLGSAASIASAVKVEDTWSVEAWVATPLPTWEWTLLASAADQKNASLVVRHGVDLGLRCEGRFFSSGFRMDTLPVGWHHITAVRKGSGKSLSVSFYVAGEKVGSSANPRFTALSLDGNDDSVTLQPASIPQGGELTVCFWARAKDPGRQPAVVLEALDAQNRCALRISLPDANGAISFACGEDASGLDQVVWTAPPAGSSSAWTHWAFTKNANTGLMRIYRNGRPWVRETGKKKSIAPTTAVSLGKSAGQNTGFFCGDLSDLCVWNKELPASDIQSAMGCPVATDDAALLGCFRFEGGEQPRAKDFSKQAKHGNLEGSPTILTIGPPTQVDIAKVTDTVNLEPPLPAVPPPPPPPPPPPVRGPLQALVLDGIDDHVKIPEMTVDFSQGLTIEAWVYYDKFQSYGRIFDFGNGVGNDNIVLYNNATNPALTLGIFRGTGDTGAFTGKPDSLVKDRWIHVAATIDALGNATLYCNGSSLVTVPSPLPNSVKRTSNLIGKTNWSDGTTFCGKMAEVKLWNRARTATEISQTMNQQLTGTEPGLVGYWAFAASGAIDLTPNKRHGTYVGNPTVTATNVPALQPPPSVPAPPPAPTPTPAPVVLPPPSLPPLKVFELRVWGTALSDEEVAVNSKTLLSGNEPGLLAYLPMSEPTGQEVRDLTGRGQNGTIEVASRWACSAQIGLLGKGRDSLVCAEYGSVALDPATQRKTSIMRRFFASATKGGVLVLPDKRVEELDLLWIGNAQFAPTLLGYIEGAPPIPSENLTENPSYNGATSVELVTSEDLEFRWNRSQEIGAGLSLDGFIGYEDQVLNPMSGMSKALDVRAGWKLNFNLNKTWQSETNITTRSSNRLTDRLELRGTPEQTPKFPDIGLRYIPKNVGYALVISGTADVFIMRLMRSGKMIGYQASPIEGIPPDVNTITFLMNPAYVMQGSLDGLTGSKPTSDRFHRHVPAMRAQYGGLYPASYYRLKEAYALKQQIENDDKRRESFFAQFSTSGMAASMESQIDEAKDPEAIGVSPGGGAGADQEQQKKESAEAAGAQSDAVKKKQAEIDRMIADPGQRAQAEAGFSSWQKKMERLQVLAGKRNIVNTYVWDADGGLRTEQQSFASTAEHMVGGSFSVDGALGAEGQINVMGMKAELTAMANMSFTQTMNKTRSTSKGIELNVDLSGVESIGITNHDDEPILPGEKVDRYRFMTFYLEGSTQNFHDFWSYVVDPEWLRSNGEEARALRQAMGKANKAWRVLHRVTYVERPALRGVGRDVRQAMDLAPDTAFDVVTKYLQSLTKNQLSIQAQLNDAVKILQGLRLKMGS